jgi:Nitrile hydratase, alpha chain
MIRSRRDARRALPQKEKTMSETAAHGRRELEDKIVARAWADESFRERLKADPRAAVAEETGVTVPESVAIEVLEETPTKAYLVIPSNRMAISDESLDVAGGGGYHFGHGPD